jgi:hypothetical protein
MRRVNPSSTENLRETSEHGRGGDLTAFYEEDAEEKLAEADPASVYRGRHVIWLGIPGRMIEIDRDYVTAMIGNVFYPLKLRAVVDAVEARELVVFDAAYGTVQMVTPIDVGESQDAFDRYESDMERPYTTGDEEADDYLLALARGEVRPDQDLTDYVEQLQRQKKGDLGKLTYTVRDGNHRVFGAILGGETKIWMIVAANQLQDVEQLRKSGRPVRTKYDRLLAEISERLE